MRQFVQDAHAKVRKAEGRKNSVEHWLHCDTSELIAVLRQYVEQRGHVGHGEEQGASWYGGLTYHQRKAMIETGDLSTVAKSDALLSEMTAYMPEATRKGWMNDVAGAVPNVPAYIAGHPMNMRRRFASRDEYAPLCIIYDPTCSGAISPEAIRKRGIAVLALVRALAGMRPVELWVVSGLSHGYYDANYLATRIETAPLDLARAAHFMTHAGHIRGIMYKIQHGYGAGPHWPFHDYKLAIGSFTESCQQAFPWASDILAIPAIHVADELLTAPRVWLQRTMTKLLGDMAEAA